MGEWSTSILLKPVVMAGWLYHGPIEPLPAQYAPTDLHQPARLLLPLSPLRLDKKVGACESNRSVTKSKQLVGWYLHTDYIANSLHRIESTWAV